MSNRFATCCCAVTSFGFDSNVIMRTMSRHHQLQEKGMIRGQIRIALSSSASTKESITIIVESLSDNNATNMGISSDVVCRRSPHQVTFLSRQRTNDRRFERPSSIYPFQMHINASHTKWQLLHDADCRTS